MQSEGAAYTEVGDQPIGSTESRGCRPLLVKIALVVALLGLAVGGYEAGVFNAELARVPWVGSDLVTEPYLPVSEGTLLLPAGGTSDKFCRGQVAGSIVLPGGDVTGEAIVSDLPLSWRVYFCGMPAGN